MDRALSTDGRALVLERTTSWTHYRNSIDVANESAKLNVPVLAVVLVALFADYLLLTLCVPILPSFFGQTYDPLSIGLLFACKPMFQLIANPIMGSTVDRIGPKLPLIVGVFILALATLLFAYGLSLSDNLTLAYRILASARCIQGVASASTMSAGLTLCTLSHHESIRGTAMGLSMLGVALGTLAGPPLGGIIGFYVNYWAPFVIVGLLLMIDGTLQIYFLFVRKDIVNLERYNTGDAADNENEQGVSVSLFQFTQLLTDRHIAVVALIATVANAAIGLIEPLVPYYLSHQLNADVLLQGLVFSCATASYLVSTPFAGYISDHFPKSLCISFGCTFLGIGMCLFSAGNCIAVVCISLVFIGIGMSFIDTPILPLLSELVEAKQVSGLGQIFSLNDMALCIGFTIGPIVGPALQQSFGDGSEGFHRAALCFGTVSLVGVLLSSVLLRESTWKDSPDDMSKFVSTVTAAGSSSLSAYSHSNSSSMGASNSLHTSLLSGDVDRDSIY